MANDHIYENPTLVTKAAKVGGIFSAANETDWFRVDLVAGSPYVIRMEGAAGKGPVLEELSLFSPQGQLLHKVTGSQFAFPVLAFTPSVSGSFYLSANSAAAGGAYAVSLADAPRDDLGNTFETAVDLASGAQRRGVLEVETDIDVFAVHHQSGKHLVVELESGPVDAIGDFHLAFYDADGKPVYPNGMSGSTSVKTFIFNGAALVKYVQVFADPAGGGGAYRLSTLNSAADLQSEGASTTGRLSVNGTAAGEINYMGDVDAFRISLEAGVKYVFDVHGAASGAGTFLTGTGALTLVNPHQVWLNYAYDIHDMAEARLVLIAPVSGDYLLRVHNSSDGRSVGTYTVTSKQLTGDGTAPNLTSGPAAQISSTGKLSLTFNELVSVNPQKFSITDASGQHVLDSSLLAVSRLHDTVSIDPLHFLRPGTSYTLNIGAGGVSDMNGNAYAGASSFVFTTATVAGHGSDGSDLIASPGGRYVDGGPGADAVLLTGLRADYTLLPLANGGVQVLPVRGGASDVLVNVERIYFADQALALDVNANAGMAYRLYQAAFNRAPDSAGVGYWMSQIDNGTSLKAVADAFVNSTEFQRQYGSFTTDAEFVSLLYANVLHREGDAAGLAYWNGFLAQGGERAQALAAFSESAENVTAVAQVIGQGFVFAPF